MGKSRNLIAERAMEALGHLDKHDLESVKAYMADEVSSQISKQSKKLENRVVSKYHAVRMVWMGAGFGAVVCLGIFFNGCAQTMQAHRQTQLNTCRADVQALKRVCATGEE
jgi:type VI protein secretion system component VasF